MDIEPIPIRAMLEAFEKWMAAIRARSLQDARFQVDQLQAVGQMLAFDPEFVRLYAQRESCPDQTPQQVLECLHAFCRTMTDAALSGRYRSGSPGQ